MAEKSSHTEPCFHCASRCGCRSQGTIQGSSFARRSIHISRQRSPTTPGSGGRELKANMVEAQLMFSVIRHPPM